MAQGRDTPDDGKGDATSFWGRANDSETVPARYTHSARDHGLDGLRGIAIVLVLVGHTNFVFPFAATVGVTLFFVLSGYLITEACERPPLRTFYSRRLARLAPALSSVVVVAAVVSALRGDANTLVGALVSLTYASNWLPSMGVDVGAMGPPGASPWRSSSTCFGRWPCWPSLASVRFSSDSS